MAVKKIISKKAVVRTAASAPKTTTRAAAKVVKATAADAAKKLKTATKAAARRSASEPKTTPTPVVRKPGVVGGTKFVAGQKVTPKAAKTKVAPAKVPTGTDTPKQPTVRKFITDLLLERQYTDEEIHAKVVEIYGEGTYTTNKAYVQLTRSDLNGGYMKKVQLDGLLTGYINRLVRDASGTLVEIPYKPSPNRKRELQFDLAQ